MADKPAHVPSQDDAPTVRPMREPIVLVAGGPEELVAATLLAAAHESPSIVVETCAAQVVGSAAAALRPFALVVSQDVYAFDPDEFGALARDVRAELVVLKVTNMRPGFLEQALRPSLRNAFRRYRSECESEPVPR